MTHKRVLFNISRKQTLIFAVLGVITLIIVIIITTILSQLFFTAPTYELIIVSPGKNPIQIATTSALPIELIIKTKPSLISLSSFKPPDLITVIDQKVVNIICLDFEKNKSSQIISKKIKYSIAIKSLTDGFHSLEVSLLPKQPPTQKLAIRRFKIIKDTTNPILQTYKILEKNPAKITISNAPEGNKNIQIFDTRPNKTSFVLEFSEPGKLSIASTESNLIKWDKQATSSAYVLIPANQKPFKTRYQFKDLVGLSTEGEFSYYYDNIGPTITLTSVTTMTNKWGMGYAVMFKVSEPIKSSSVTFKDKLYQTHTDVMGNYVTSFDLDFGTNTFTITATDLNNNTTTKSFTVSMSQDPSPVFFGVRKSTFRKCTEELRKNCESKTGWGPFVEDCSKFEDYKKCLKEVCDSTTVTNVCP